nr:G protein-coupled receptor [Proales similis]
MNNFSGQLFQDPSEHLINVVLTHVDMAATVFAFVQHIFYFVMIMAIRELQQPTLLFVHHVNLVSFLFCVHYMLYIYQLHPTFDDANLNHNICRLSELAWALLRYARLYGVLLVAVLRLIAVVNIPLYKRLIVSKWFVLISICSVWLISILIFISTKVGFQTTYGLIYCLDGYSSSQMNSVWYYITTSTIGTLLPTLSVCILYGYLSKRLKRISKNLPNPIRKKSRDRAAQTKQENGKLMENKNRALTRLQRLEERRKQRESRFAWQFLIINFSVIVSSITILIISIVNIIHLAPIFARFYFFSQLVRILNMISISATPLITLLFNKTFVQWFKSKILQRSIASNHS